MNKKHSTLGLHSGPPRHYKTEQEVSEQLNRSPKLSGPSLATRAVQRTKATKAKPAADE